MNSFYETLINLYCHLGVSCFRHHTPVLQLLSGEGARAAVPVVGVLPEPLLSAVVPGPPGPRDVAGARPITGHQRRGAQEKGSSERNYGVRWIFLR